MAGSLTEPLIGLEGSSSSELSRNNGNIEENLDSPAWLMTEIRKQLSVAGPMVCVYFLLYAINLVSVIFVGHAGELELASAAVASSFCSVIGFSVLAGMSSALETLCGQAYGAKQYSLLGIYMQRGIVVLYATSIPIAVVAYNIGSLLRILGQDPEISEYAGLYSRCLIPALFAVATMQALLKFLQAQSKVLVMALCAALTLSLHILLCWMLIFKLGVGYRGAAIANSVSQWLNVVFVVVYITFSPDTCGKTWSGFSTEAFHDLKQFFKLAISSAVMLCLEYWSFELVVLMSGLLPNPQLEMAATSICLSTMTVWYMIPFGLCAGVSTRVSNELGAGRASAAKRAVMVGATMGLASGLTVSCLTLLTRNISPYVFTNVPELVDYVSDLMLYMAVMTVGDSTQGVLSGALRGSGMQDYGAYTNLGAYYAVGMPLAIIFAFFFHLNSRGIWLGIIAAVSIQATAVLIICIFTDWDKQAKKAVDRVYINRLPSNGIHVDKDDSTSPLIQGQQ